MKPYPLLIATALASCHMAPATAGVVDTWSGAGPNACMGNCSYDWAVSQLSEAERIELFEYQEVQPESEIVFVSDGDVFSWMSYAPEGEPVGYRTTTVAVLAEDELSEGWVVGDWAFVKLAACQNWAVVQLEQNVGPTAASGGGTYAQSSSSGTSRSGGGFTSSTGGSGGGSKTTPPQSPPPFDPPKPPPLFDPDPDPPGDFPPIEVASVPLPANSLLLLTGLAAFAFARKKRT